jgi:hypothetical protein
MLRVIAIIVAAFCLSACAAGGSIQSISGAPQINSTLTGAVDVYSTVPDPGGNANTLRAGQASSSPIATCSTASRIR